MYLYNTYVYIYTHTHTHTEKHALSCIFLWTDIIVFVLMDIFQMAAQTGKFASLERLVLPSTINCV